MQDDQFPWSVEKFAASLLANLIVKGAEALVRLRQQRKGREDEQTRAVRGRRATGNRRPGGSTRPPQKDAAPGRRSRRHGRRSKH
ncbi:hypothetical protein ACFC1T_02200 [Kitasatospora sp. NPDC056076]|uniref:hypothetical protein n=1 Tax=Kitasatospora sp. NPDC056076 TaxID=3345703 RepID=UPI0035D92361